jgi:hypothetical protein
MSNIYKPSTGGGGGGAVIIADDGNSISTSPYYILGQKAEDVPVESTAITGGQLFVANNTWDTQYVVDPSTTLGLKGTFTTIQAAIDEAVADGARFGVYKVIRLRCTTYTENLTIPGGIIIQGQSIPQLTGGITTPYEMSAIIGNHTFTGNAVGGFKNVNFVAASGDIFSGGSIVLWYSTDCFFLQQATDYTFNITPSSSFLSFTNCQFVGNGNAISIPSGALVANNCSFLNGASIVLGSQNTTISNCTGINSISCSFSSIDISNCTFSTNTAAYHISGTASGIIQGCQFSGASTAAIQNTITCAIMNCSSFTPTLLYETGTVYSNSLFQQGSIIRGKTITLAGSSPYVVLIDDHFIGVNNTIVSGAQIILPSTLSPVNEGQEFIIKDVVGNALTNNISVIVDSGKMIDGASSATINQAYGILKVRFDGTNYSIL